MMKLRIFYPEEIIAKACFLKGKWVFYLLKIGMLDVVIAIVYFAISERSLKTILIAKLILVENFAIITNNKLAPVKKLSSPRFCHKSYFLH
jgi:hypothetical protein